MGQEEDIEQLFGSTGVTMCQEISYSAMRFVSLFGIWQILGLSFFENSSKYSISFGINFPLEHTATDQGGMLTYGQQINAYTQPA